MKMGKHIASWTQKNFKLGRPKSIDLSNRAKQLNSEMISTVHESSPAFLLRIKPGWLLISVNGKPYDARSIFLKKFKVASFGQSKYEFYDPATKQSYLLKGKYWPFGIVLTQPPSKIADTLLNNGNVSITDIHNLWSLGLIPAMGELYPALEACCADKAGHARPTALPPKNEPFPIGVHVDLTAALSLSAFAAGHMERAEYIHRLTEARLKESLSTSNYTKSLHAYVGSVLSDLKEDHEQAIKFAQRAYKITPDVAEVRSQLERLTGETHAPVAPEIGPEFKIEYELPNIDPVGEVPSTGKMISFQNTLDQLGTNQLLLVFVMGSYRSNSYYTDDILAAAPIFKAFLNKVKAVHVICEGDYTLYPEDRKDFEKLAMSFKLPLTILYDREKTVSSKINASGYPCRFFYNKKGELLSTEKLWDETAIWEAFRKS